jgi:PAS domain S-box-containing protein
MKKELSEINSGNDLRRLAEERLKNSRSSLDSSAAVESRDALALVHELQVHQIELEMQNEALKLAKLETEDVLTKYSDLYDFAPMGLFSFDVQGQIQEINLAGAKLLGMERRNLMARRFQQFVAPKDRPSFGEFCKKAFEASTKQTCEFEPPKGRRSYSLCPHRGHSRRGWLAEQKTVQDRRYRHNRAQVDGRGTKESAR